MKVWVGGDLPESAIPDLVEALKDGQVQLIEGWDATQEPVEKLIRDFKEPNSIELEFDVDRDMDGTVTVSLDLDTYCETHGLTIKKLLPPCVDSQGNHNNEGLYYWQPGMDNPMYIPTDGEGEIILLQKDALELHEQCWTLSQRPLSDMGLLINDSDDVTRLYAIASMAGQTFPEIYRDLLVSRVGHEEVGCPPFRIIQGR